MRSRLITPVSASIVGALVVATLSVAAVVPAGATVAAKKPNACKVLKASEVTTVTGFTATKSATQQQGPPGAGICGYTLADQTVRTVSVFVQPGSATTAKLGFTTAKKAFKDQLEPVTGFGKNAFYAGGGLNTLYVLKGDTLLYVQYVAIGADPATIKANVEAMTKIAVPRV
jgi:hypothetical protein